MEMNFMLSVLALGGVCCAGQDGVQGNVLLDFATTGVTYSCGLKYRPDAPEKQFEITEDGLTVRNNAAYETRLAPWMTFSVPKALGGKIDWSNRKFRLLMPTPPEGRAMSNIAVNFKDRDGEIKELMRSGEGYTDDGLFYLLFDYKGLKSNKGWGTPKANGILEPPVSLDSISIHFEGRGAIGHAATKGGRGQATFLRIEEIAAPKTYPRTVASVEPISTDTMYPGAKPFPGAEAIALTVQPAVSGTATLRLSYDSKGAAYQGTMTNFTARMTGGVVRFETRLPYGTPYEFFNLEVVADGARAQTAVTVVDARGEFRQSAAEAMRLSVETGHPLHLVRDGKAERPRLIVHNPVDRALAWKTTFTLRDYFGRVVELPFAQTVPAGGTQNIEIPWPLPARGLWRVMAEVEGEDGSKANHESRFAWIDLHEVTPIVDKPKFRMGIHYHGTRYLPNKVDHTIAAMVAAGAKFTRCDYDHMWADVEKRPGVYNWERSDLMIGKLRQAGLSLDIIFHSTPGWAADPNGNWTRAKTPGRRIRGGCRPARPGLLRRFAEDFARRYGPQIDYYETGNEWELVSNEEVTKEDYLAIMKEAYEGIHAGYPGATVTPCGWACAISLPENDAMPSRYCTGVVDYLAEHPECYDAWALHCHGDPANFRVNLLERFLPMRASKPLAKRPWLLNETALTCANGQEDAVASAVWQKILFGWSYGAQDYIWYNLRATGWFDGGEPGYGLITPDDYPRAGYAAFAALSTLVQGLDADGILFSKGPRQLFRFKGTSQALANGLLLAGWDTQTKNGRRTLRVATDATRAEMVDLMGNRTPLAIRAGEVSFTIGYSPRALLLQGATRAEVQNLSDLEQAAVDALALSDSARAPLLTLDSAKFVKDRYEANPAMIHRLWKGPADHSARIWITPCAGGVRFRALVRDDVRADGDRLELVLTQNDQRTVHTAMPSVRRGKTDVYELVLPVTGTRFGIDFKIFDDDGEGEDSYLYLREPDANPLWILLDGAN